MFPHMRDAERTATLYANYITPTNGNARNGGYANPDLGLGWGLAGVARKEVFSRVRYSKKLDLKSGTGEDG